MGYTEGPIKGSRMKLRIKELSLDIEDLRWWHIVLAGLVVLILRLV